MPTGNVPLAPGRLFVKPFQREDPTDEPVNLWGMSTAVARWWIAATEELARRGIYSMATSANDETHRAGSHHYRGDAIDLRSHHVPREQLDDVLAALVSIGLEHRVRVIIENRGKAAEHFHAELRPDLIP